MSFPNVSVIVEPSQGDSIIYQRLAKETSDSPHKIKIGFVLIMKNNEVVDLYLDKVKIIYKHSTGPFQVFEYAAGLLFMKAGMTTIWEMKGGSKVDGGQQIVLNTIPLPSSSLTLILEFREPPEPFSGAFVGSVTITKSLTPHIPPPSVGLVGYSFPGKLEDLEEGEYWQSPDTHGIGGEEIFAHDLGVMKYNPDAAHFTEWRFKVDNNGKIEAATLNESYRVWEKPVYAMADGKVMDFDGAVVSNMDDNKIGGVPGADSNHVWIQHGGPNGEAVVYAHFRKDTIDTTKIFRNAPISKGQFLGNAGNSGGSGEPHLHIGAFKLEASQKGHVRPLLFTNTSILSYNEIENNPDPQWVNLHGDGLPTVWAAVYPKAKPVPTLSLRALLVAKGYSFPASIRIIAKGLGLTDPFSIREFMKRLAAV